MGLRDAFWERSGVLPGERVGSGGGCSKMHFSGPMNGIFGGASMGLRNAFLRGVGDQHLYVRSWL